MAKQRNRMADTLKAQEQAQAFVSNWLSNNLVLPKDVKADEKQFEMLMNNVVRGLMAAYAKGFFDGIEVK